MKKFKDIIEYNIEEITSDIEIVEIIDVVMPKKEDADISESAFLGIHSNFANKEIKRGDYIYITAIIKKPTDSVTSPGSQAVLKTRITDIYNGFSILNTIK